MEQIARLLVIDDEEAARYGMRRALANQGYQLEEAGGGREALDLVRAFRPDAVISDINMPGMDGLALLRAVQQEAEPPVVVLVTAYGSESVAVEALRAGAYDYLPKPFEIEDLRRVARSAVARRRQLREDRLHAEQLRCACQEFQTSYSELVQAGKMTALAGLVAGVAHEVNTPLGALQSSVDTVRRAADRLRDGMKKMPPECQAFSTVLLAALSDASAQARLACARIDGVVNNLVQFAELDRAEWRGCDLHEGLEAALRLLEPELRGRITVEREYGNLPEVVCRPRDLNQVFFHLLQNAIDAIRAAGRAGAIRIRTGAEGGRFFVDIEDNGCGIGPGHLPRIFDPGFTTKGVQVGLGLGLAICYRIVQAHGGRIEVESRPGAGSTFRVTAPARGGA